MTVAEWIGVAALLVTLVGYLVAHASEDARRGAQLEDAIKRLDKIDGNGSGKDRIAALEREVNQNLRPRIHDLSNDVHLLLHRSGDDPR